MAEYGGCAPSYAERLRAASLWESPKRGAPNQEMLGILGRSLPCQGRTAAVVLVMIKELLLLLLLLLPPPTAAALHEMKSAGPRWVWCVFWFWDRVKAANYASSGCKFVFPEL
jgi:hypothetical protein